MSVAVALIGFATLLLGGFSRMGLWRQIGFAVALLVVVQGIVDGDAARLGRVGHGWILAYVAPLLGLAHCSRIVVVGRAPRRIGRAVAA